MHMHCTVIKRPPLTPPSTSQCPYPTAQPTGGQEEDRDPSSAPRRRHPGRAFAFADPLFTQLNQAQQAAAATARARFADPFPAFDPQGDPAAETAAICALTLLCGQGDGHPSDVGYRALAGIVWAASGYASLR